jgi:hypothetical protein
LGGYWLARSRHCPRPITFRRLFTFCGRLFPFNLFACVIITDFVTCATRNLGAKIAIGLEAVLADQRTYAPGLCLDGIERIETRDLHIEFHAGVLVEQIKRPLRRRIPIAVD